MVEGSRKGRGATVGNVDTPRRKKGRKVERRQCTGRQMEAVQVYNETERELSVGEGEDRGRSEILLSYQLCLIQARAGRGRRFQ